MKTNLVIIPTRSRPDKAKAAAKAVIKNSIISDVMLGLDDDDADKYLEDKMKNVLYEVNPRLRMNGTLNLLATKYADRYETITFMGDDHMVRTLGWDEKLFKPIDKRGYGLSYGNDLFQGQNLATAVMMSTNIIKQLGFMAPPKLIHLYMDNFWMALGNILDCIDYHHDVIIEHMHFLNGKSEADAGYHEVNSSEVGNHDADEFRRYMEENMKDDAIKVLTAVLK
jgi:hypothetical protein